MSADRAVHALAAILPPGTSAKTTLQEGRDACVSVGGRRLRLRWVPVGWPRQVTEALQIPPRPDIVAAPRLSPGARALASREKVGWVDESGAAQISTGTLLIRVDGDPAVPLDANVGWRPAALAVCEVLLTGCEATVSAVVGKTGLAMSTAATALKFLEHQGFLGSDAARGRYSRRQAADTDELVDAYAAAAARLRPPTSARLGVLWRDPVTGTIEAGHAWRRAGIDWAATSALSAAVLAPAMTEVTPMEVYVSGRTPGDLRRAAASAGLHEIEGGRLLLRPFPTPAGATVTSEIAPGLRSVLWPRAYADLRTAGVRGEDAAEQLREEMSRAGR
jgi:hypothetical protein